MILTEEQVRDIFMRQYVRMKPALLKGRAVKFAAITSEPWPGFIAAQRQRTKIMPHVSEGVFPEHLFTALAPNQTEAELKWMRANFEHTTLTPYLDLENTVGRGLHETNWNLKIGDEEVETHVNRGIREWGGAVRIREIRATEAQDR